MMVAFFLGVIVGFLCAVVLMCVSMKDDLSNRPEIPPQ